MLQKSPFSFIFQHVFPYQINHKKRRETNQNLSRQEGRRGTTPSCPAEVSVPTVCDYSHNPALGCGFCGHKLLAALCRDRIPPSGVALPKDAFGVVIFPCSGVIPFFLLIKPKLKLAGMPFGECHLLDPHCVCSCACWGHVWGCVCGAGDPGCWFQADATICSGKSGAENKTGNTNAWSWGSSPASFTWEARQNIVFIF